MQSKFGNLLLVMLLGGTVSEVLAQQVIGTLGISDTISGAHVEATAGEVVIASFSNDSNQAIIGFHQSELTVVGVEETPFTQANIRVFPNPAQLEVNIQSEVLIRAFTVLDVNGRVVYRSSVPFQAETLNVGAWANGNYFLELWPVDASTSSRFQIIKTQ